MKFFLLTILFAVAYAAPIEERNDVVNYLIRYGYMDKAELHKRQSISQATLKLQKMAHIPETGIIDQATIEFTKKPRCGLPDLVNGQPLVNRNHAVWNKRNLTYQLGSHSTLISEEEFVTNMRWAFNKWANHVQFNFTKVSHTQADINILFTPRDHGCPNQFDGPGRVLAHAAYPSIGYIHFDNEEAWGVTAQTGTIDLFSVALHEMGHVLGLHHSDVPEAVMYPDYRVYVRLSQDDIDKIQQLYPSTN